MNKQFIATGLTLLVILSGCNTGSKEEDNIQKLLDNQAQMEQAQEASDVTEKRSELEQQVAGYADSIALLKQQLFTLNNQIDSVERNISIHQVQEQQTKQYLASGISEIDQQMQQREEQKQQTLKRLELLRRRLSVNDKKMEAYQLERQRYSDELDEMLRKNVSEGELAPYRNRMAEMDSVINDQQRERETLEQEITQAQTQVAETEDFLTRMDTEIKAEYNRKSVH